MGVYEPENIHNKVNRLRLTGKRTRYYILVVFYYFVVKLH